MLKNGREEGKARGFSMEYCTVSKAVPLKQKLTQFSLIISGTSGYIYINFLPEQHNIKQYTNVSFWKRLKLHHRC